MERQTLYRGLSILRATLDECSSILTRGPDGAEWQEVSLQGKIRQVMLTDQEFAVLQNHLLTAWHELDGSTMGYLFPQPHLSRICFYCDNDF